MGVERVSGSSDKVLRFIAASLPSVWALELLLMLKREPRAWTSGELITSLRASELVISRAIDALVAAGLVSIEAEGVRFLAANAEDAKFVEQAEELYRARPDAVRRAIVGARSSSASAFADAFRLRRGEHD